MEVQYKLYYTVVTCIVTDNFSPCHLTLIQSTLCIYWKCRNSMNAYILYFKNNRTAFHKIQGKFWQLLDSFLPWYLKSALVIFANGTNYAVMPSLTKYYIMHWMCWFFLKVMFSSNSSWSTLFSGVDYYKLEMSKLSWKSKIILFLSK